MCAYHSGCTGLSKRGERQQQVLESHDLLPFSDLFGQRLVPHDDSSQPNSDLIGEVPGGTSKKFKQIQGEESSIRYNLFSDQVCCAPVMNRSNQIVGKNLEKSA